MGGVSTLDNGGCEHCVARALAGVRGRLECGVGAWTSASWGVHCVPGACLSDCKGQKSMLLVRTSMVVGPEAEAVGPRVGIDC